MSKRKKFGKVHISRMGYDLSKFYTPPKRKEKAAPGARDSGGGKGGNGFGPVSTSIITKNEEDYKR